MWNLDPDGSYVGDDEEALAEDMYLAVFYLLLLLHSAVMTTEAVLLSI